MAKWGKRKNKKPMFIIVVIIFFSAALLVWVDTKLSPIIYLVAEQRVHLAVVRLINESVEEDINNNLSYDDLVKVEKNEAGYVTLVQPDSVAISKLSTAISKSVEEKLRVLGSEGISVPSGVISGMTLLANLGPAINVRVQPIGTVDVAADDEFISVGINQSKYRLNLSISTTMNIAVPFNEKNMEVKSSLPLVETIIVGPVPNTYLNVGN